MAGPPKKAGASLIEGVRATSLAIGGARRRALRRRCTATSPAIGGAERRSLAIGSARAAGSYQAKRTRVGLRIERYRENRARPGALLHRFEREPVQENGISGGERVLLDSLLFLRAQWSAGLLENALRWALGGALARFRNKRGSRADRHAESALTRRAEGSRNTGVCSSHASGSLGREYRLGLGARGARANREGTRGARWARGLGAAPGLSCGGAPASRLRFVRAVRGKAVRLRLSNHRRQAPDGDRPGGPSGGTTQPSTHQRRPTHEVQRTHVGRLHLNGAGRSSAPTVAAATAVPLPKATTLRRAALAELTGAIG